MAQKRAQQLLHHTGVAARNAQAMPFAFRPEIPDISAVLGPPRRECARVLATGAELPKADLRAEAGLCQFRTNTDGAFWGPSAYSAAQ